MTHSATNRSAGHQHDRRCYWDYMQCGWVCGPRPATEPGLARPDEEPEPTAPGPAQPLAVRTDRIGATTAGL